MESQCKPNENFSKIFLVQIYKLILKFLCKQKDPGNKIIFFKQKKRAGGFTPQLTLEQHGLHCAGPYICGFCPIRILENSLEMCNNLKKFTHTHVLCSLKISKRLEKVMS